MKITVLKSGYITGGLEPKAQSVSENGKYNRAEGNYAKRAQLVFGTDSFEIDKALEKSLVLLTANESGGDVFWDREVLSMFRAEARHNGLKTEETLESVQYMEFSESLDKMDKVLGCACLRWSTSDELDYSKMKEGKDAGQEVGVWFGIEPFSSVAERISVVRENHPIKPFILLRYSAQQKFYDNRFSPNFAEAL